VIESSLAWRLIKRYRKFNDKWFPPGTKRRGLVERCASAVRVSLDEGLSGLLHRAYHRHPRQPSIDEQYQLWLKSNQLTDRSLLEMQTEASQFSYKPKISIIMPVYNTDQRWLRAAIDSVMNQVYTNWELCVVDDASTRKEVRRVLAEYANKGSRIAVKYLDSNLGISATSNEALSMATGEFVGFLDHDDELGRDALYEVVNLLNENPDLDLIYSDEDKKELNGKRVEPFFKPDWSPDLLLSMNYVCHFVIMRKSLIDKVGGFRLGFEGSQDYDLLLRIVELTNRIGHISRPLYSWRKVAGSAAASTSAKPFAHETAKKALMEALSRRGLKGEVLEAAGKYHRVAYAIEGDPLVSIIIPTRDRVDLLRRCIESIECKTSYQNYEIIIVDNGSEDPTTLYYLRSTRHRVLKFDEPFNFSRLNNFGAAHAKGEHLLFLNNDTEVADDHWLEAMLEHSQRPEVGMVGALLLYPSRDRSHRMIQHAGVNVGVGGVAGHAFKYLPADRDNYFNLHRVVRNCSAVTAACAMIRRSVFGDVGGFDERLKVAFGDVDLCLRAREKGYLVIYTPHAILYHHETATRGNLHPMEDEDYMITRWKDTLFKGDPYYNPNLTLLREDYSIASKGSSIRPLAILLDIYYLRPDLQRAFPEARNGDYQRLVEWAATYGTTIDAVHVPLRAYASYYYSYCARVNQIRTMHAQEKTIR
jgi:GT2 family glycosyltransferase